jgi:hypothetical protein
LKEEQEVKEREILAEKQAALQKRKDEMKLAKQVELLCHEYQLSSRSGRHTHHFLHFFVVDIFNSMP